MKIGLNFDGKDEHSVKAAEMRSLERIILDAKKGDWEAKEMLFQKFRPLILSLVDKRTKDTQMTNKYMEAAKAGLISAASKYSASVGAEHFRIFALDYIERNMDHVAEHGGFFSRLFRFGNK